MTPHRQAHNHSRPRVRVSGMIWAHDQLLLIRQGREDRPRWMLPGGGVEPGEDLQHALQRELSEELCIEVCDVKSPAALAESIAPPDDRSGRHLIHVIFHVDCAQAALDRVDAADPAVKEARLVARDELADLPLHPPIAEFLRNWQPGVAFAYLGSLWAP